MKNSHDLILSPILSEKSVGSVPDKRYTFVVHKTANKTEIRQALEEIFGVKVASVNTVITMGKIKRQGRTEGRRPTVKKAIVRLKPDSKGIEVFDSLSR